MSNLGVAKSVLLSSRMKAFLGWTSLSCELSREDPDWMVYGICNPPSELTPSSVFIEVDSLSGENPKYLQCHSSFTVLISFSHGQGASEVM